MHASIHPGGNGQAPAAASASQTTDKNLLEVPRGPVTQETVATLTEGGFSSEFVAMAKDLASR
jgi:hypothetical protein